MVALVTECPDRGALQPEGPCDAGLRACRLAALRTLLSPARGTNLLLMQYASSVSTGLSFVS